MRWAVAGLALLATGCTGEEDVAWLLQYERVQIELDRDHPQRTWNLAVGTNASAGRDGPTWTTLEVEGLLFVGDVPQGSELWIDATLAGDEVAEDHQMFTAAGRGAVRLRERYQADCVDGEPCAWDYGLAIGRREGNTEVLLDITVRALITLGPESEAPEGAVLTVEAQETTPEG